MKIICFGLKEFLSTNVEEMYPSVLVDDFHLISNSVSATELLRNERYGNWRIKLPSKCRASKLISICCNQIELIIIPDSVQLRSAVIFYFVPAHSTALSIAFYLIYFIGPFLSITLFKFSFLF